MGELSILGRQVKVRLRLIMAQCSSLPALGVYDEDYRVIEGPLRILMGCYIIFKAFTNGLFEMKEG
jgi:hypothetical protein